MDKQAVIPFVPLFMFCLRQYPSVVTGQSIYIERRIWRRITEMKVLNTQMNVFIDLFSVTLRASKA